MKDKNHLSLLDMMTYVRDSGLTRNSQQSLLYHLILRCNPKEGYSCWPSYDLLCRDTGLDLTTLKRAARALEEADLVKRKIRHNHSNLWYVNVGKIQKVAEANRAAWGADKDEAELSSPFEPPVVKPKVSAPTEAVVQPTDEDEGTDESSAAQNVEEVLELVRFLWPEHPSFADPSGVTRLHRDLTSCVTLAGSAATCGRLLAMIHRFDQRTAQSVKDSAKLGPYLRKCFPGWLKNYEDWLQPEEEAEVEPVDGGSDEDTDEALFGSVNPVQITDQYNDDEEYL